MKSQSDIWEGPHLPRVQKELTMFAYNNGGVIVTNRVPKGTIVTGAYYGNFLHNILHLKICKLLPGVMESGMVIIHNVYPHTSAPVIKILDKHDWEWLCHLAYSPDLRPPDFDLFPELKEPLLDIHFPTLDVL